jgi:hypothetical protein
MHQEIMEQPHVHNPASNELTSYKDLIINYLIRSNSQVAHTLTHTQSTLATLEAFHLAGSERAKTRKRTAYQRSALEDNTPAGVLLISAATAGFQGIPFTEWLAWARMMAKSGLNMPDQPLAPAEIHALNPPPSPKRVRKSKSSQKTTG